MEKDPLLPKSTSHKAKTNGSRRTTSGSVKNGRQSGKRASSTRSRSTHSASLSSRRPSLALPKRLPYDVTRVRIVTSTVIIFAGMVYFPMTVLISQYMFQRLAKEALIRSNFTWVDFTEVQESATRKIQHYTYMQCVPALFSSLLVGAYSDFIGRRITLLLPLLGQLAKCVIVLCIVKYDLAYDYFYIGYAVDGILGSWFVSLTAVYSITADMNFYKEQRLLWIMISAGLANVASSISLTVNALVTVHVNYTLAACLLTGYNLVAVLVPFIFLQETLPPPEMTPANPCRSIRRVFSIFTTDGEIKHRLTLVTLLIMFFFSVINDIGCPSIDVLYQMSPPFSFDPNMVGLYAVIKIGGQAFFGMFLMRLLQIYLKAEYIGMIASVFQSGMYVMEAFVKNSWQMMLVPAVGIPGCLIGPTVRGIMSVLAGPDHQGAVFASIAVGEALSTMAANSILYEVYARTVAHYEGTVYLTMAAFAAAPLLLFLVYFRLYEFGNYEYYYEEYVETPEEFAGSGSITTSISMNNSYSRERERKRLPGEHLGLSDSINNAVVYDIGHQV